jgi:hypothetical protein
VTTVQDHPRDFVDAATFLACHPQAAAVLQAELTIQVPVPLGLDRPGKLQWLDGWAESWGVEPVTDDDGVTTAERRFGGLRFVASVDAPGSRRIIKRQDDLDQRAPVAAVMGAAA